MAVQLDWSLAGPGAGSIVQNALAGYQAGQQVGQERRTRNALAAYAQDPSRIGDVIAADPRTGIALQHQAEDTRRAMRQESQQTLDRDRARTGQMFVGLLGVPEAQRRAAAIAHVSDLGLSPDEQARVLGVLQNPETRWDDASVALYARNAGANPDEGAYNIGLGERRMVGNREIGHGGRPNPQIVSLNNGQYVIANQAQIDEWDRLYGGGAAPPANPTPQGDVPQIAAPAGVGAGSGVGAGRPDTLRSPDGSTPAPPAPPAGSLAAVFAAPEDRAAAALYVHGESGHGPGEDAAILSALANNAAAAGMSAAQFLRANPSFSYAFSRGNGATRRFDPNGQAAQGYNQTIDGLISGQIPLSPYTNFEGASFPLRNFEHDTTTIGHTRFTTNPLAGGSRGRAQPAANPAAAPAQQTAPEGASGPGGLRVYGTDRTIRTEQRQDAADQRATNADARAAAAEARAAEAERRRNTPERTLTPAEVRAQGLDPNLTYRVDGNNHVTALPRDPNTVTPRQRAQTTLQIQTQFRQDPEVQAFNQVAQAYETVSRLASNPRASAQDDTALTYSYMRMLDPTSVVREGEFAMVARAAGVPDRIVIALQAVDRGRGLTPNIRREIAAAAQTVYQSRVERYNELVRNYQTTATQLGLDPTVIRPRGNSRRSAPQGAFAGASASSGPGRPAPQQSRPAATQRPAAGNSARSLSDDELRRRLGL